MKYNGICKNRKRLKIQNEDGATLVIALVIFLCCALVGSIVLASASSAAGRIKGLKESDSFTSTMYSVMESYRDWVDDTFQNKDFAIELQMNENNGSIEYKYENKDYDAVKTAMEERLKYRLTSDFEDYKTKGNLNKHNIEKLDLPKYKNAENYDFTGESGFITLNDVQGAEALGYHFVVNVKHKKSEQNLRFELIYQTMEEVIEYSVMDSGSGANETYKNKKKTKLTLCDPVIQVVSGGVQ